MAKKTYSLLMDKYAPLFAGLLVMIIGLLYKINENSTNNSSPSNQSSFPKQAQQSKLVGNERRCSFCSVRMPLDAKVCLNCQEN